MKANTRFFGEVTFEEKDLFIFVQGMPGLEAYTRYLLIPVEEGVPFYYMQSIEEPNLAFMITDPFQFFLDYDFSVDELLQQELKLEGAGEVEVWSVVTVNENLEEATINLLAPIVVNSGKKLAKQIILHDSAYQVKEKLLLPTEAAAKGE
ncbi:flagellar assembly factor FliW [Paenibacillus sp. UNCCL117]|uniref:flagellar assembly protein FliW n=1 Tax=unclassified Paenibacillus TaxID=185978 RepID=UPI00087FEA0A|nr:MULTISPECIES: flagellar assembly protein FliW [unclassified Paenibacillus]SDE50260.1 flagellar assembly factor FliW [Paenibacillus sp. cl123]SFW67399.1 flagellar assembly factor FliW [Paenibacillus sp. UNCCL117]